MNAVPVTRVARVLGRCTGETVSPRRRREEARPLELRAWSSALFRPSSSWEWRGGSQALEAQDKGNLGRILAAPGKTGRQLLSHAFYSGLCITFFVDFGTFCRYIDFGLAWLRRSWVKSSHSYTPMELSFFFLIRTCYLKMRLNVLKIFLIWASKRS